MKRTKLYKIIIAALVIINVGIMVFFLVGGPPHTPPKAGDLSRILGITGSNATIVTQLEKEHLTKKNKLVRTDRELHNELFSKIGTDDDVSDIQNKIEANYMKMEKMTYSFFNAVSKQCTPEQKIELKKTIDHAFHQMRRPNK